MVDGGGTSWNCPGSPSNKLREKLKKLKDKRVGKKPDACVYARLEPCGQFASSSDSHQTRNPEIVSEILPTDVHREDAEQQGVKFDLDYALRQPLCATELDLEECPSDHTAGNRELKFRGVRKKASSFVAEIRVSTKKRIWLGSYETAELAALAHDVATYLRANYLRGTNPQYNFGSSSSAFPPSKEISDLETDEEKRELIKKIAGEFAKKVGRR
jgi:hypothetical protein